MIKNSAIVFCFLALGLGFGCSSVEPESTRTETDRTSDRQVSTGATNQTQAASADQVQSANAAPPANTIQPNQGAFGDLQRKKMDAMRAGNGPVPTTTSGPAPAPVPQPAPDNSTFTAVLTDAAVETRTFRSHPQLSKVEKRTDGKGSSIKIFMNSGRVLELPGSAIPSLSTAPAASIMQAAGLGPAPQRRTTTKGNPAEH